MCSVQFSHSVVSDSLWPHEQQHARPPCPSPTPRGHPNPCPSSRWCHPTISSSVVPSSSCPQSFPASGAFPTSWLFASGSQNIRVSASASVLPMIFRVVFLSDWLIWSCSLKDSQESSLSQFKIINSSALILKLSFSFSWALGHGLTNVSSKEPYSNILDFSS